MPTSLGPQPHYALFEERTECLHWFDAVFMRKDPPFDLLIFFATQILALDDPEQHLRDQRPARPR